MWLALIGIVLVFAGFIISGPPNANDDPVQVPGEYVHLSFIGEANAIELTD